MNLTQEQKIKILHDSAIKCGLDGHVVVSEKKSDLQTIANKALGWLGWYKNIPYKNSYLWLDSVDACFFISKGNKANMIFTARWMVGSKDLNITKLGRIVVTANEMLETMQGKINEILKEKQPCVE